MAKGAEVWKACCAPPCCCARAWPPAAAIPARARSPHRAAARPARHAGRRRPIAPDVASPESLKGIHRIAAILALLRRRMGGPTCEINGSSALRPVDASSLQPQADDANPRSELG